MNDTQSIAKTVLGLDVGSKRIGVALSRSTTRLPQPLTTLSRSSVIFEDISKLVQEHGVEAIVVGLPRSLEGHITEQTRSTMQFMKQLRQHLGVPVYEQDEALTSIQAERELVARAKPYTKSDIDALAATYILEDFLQQQEVAHG